MRKKVSIEMNEIQSTMSSKQIPVKKSSVWAQLTHVHTDGRKTISVAEHTT